MADRELSSAPPWSQGQAQPGGRRRPPRGRGLQTTSMSVYVSSDEPPVALLRALRQLVRVADLTTVQESEVERGSWFRSWRLRENQSGALGKVARLARKAERAGELRYIYGARAESDEHEANAVATVIQTLDSVDSAVIQLSSMIIVKFRGSVMCRVMSERDIEILGDHPELLKSPGELFDILSRMIDRDTGEQDLAYRFSVEEDPFSSDTTSAPPVIGL